MVKELRERTGAGMMDCKRALTEANGDMAKATEFLREKGLAAAAKKAGRSTKEGSVVAYIHGNGRVGVLIEVNCESDFVAKTDEFKNLCHELAMQVAAANPTYVAREEVPEAILEKEREILRVQALNEGKPEKIIDRMVEGRVEKFYAENCLIEQAYIRDGDKAVKQLIQEYISKLGENITVRRFVRFAVGEEVE
jgi:elongation factor Ts